MTTNYSEKYLKYKKKYLDLYNMSQDNNNQIGSGINSLNLLLDNMEIKTADSMKDKVSFYTINSYTALNKKMFFVPEKTYLIFNLNTNVKDKKNINTELDDFLYQEKDSSRIQSTSSIWYNKIYKQIKDNKFFTDKLEHNRLKKFSLNPFLSNTLIYEPGDLIQDLDITLYDTMNQNKANIWGIWHNPIPYDLKRKIENKNNPTIILTKELQQLIDTNKDNINSKISSLEKEQLTTDQIHKLNEIKPKIDILFNITILDTNRLLDIIRVITEELTKNRDENDKWLYNSVGDIIKPFISEYKKLILNTSKTDKISLRSYEDEIKTIDKQLMGKSYEINDVTEKNKTGILFNNNKNTLSSLLNEFNILKQAPYYMKEYKVILVNTYSNTTEENNEENKRMIEKLKLLEQISDDKQFKYNIKNFEKIGLNISELSNNFDVLEINKLNTIIEKYIETNGKQNTVQPTVQPIVQPTVQPIVQPTVQQIVLKEKPINKTLQILIARRKDKEEKQKLRLQKKLEEYKNNLNKIPQDKQFNIHDIVKMNDGRKGRILNIVKDDTTGNYGYRLDIILPKPRIFSPNEIV